MKYFLIETDEKNRNPYNINKNRAIDMRLLTKENIKRLSLWNVVEMSFSKEGFFPDLICHPFILLSDRCIKTVIMYQPDIVYRGIKLWDRESSANATYYLPIFEEVDCLSKKTQYNSRGNRILKLILDMEKIESKVVFRIKNYDKNCIVGRLDFVESILRRGTRGISLTEVEVNENSNRR